jgi:hypothetical protein
MSRDARALATLGIGFGTLAVATLGLLAPAQVVTPEQPAGPALGGRVVYSQSARSAEVIRAAARTLEAEQSIARAGVVALPIARSSEAETSQARAVAVQTIRSIAVSGESERVTAIAANPLDWARINAQDEELLMLM